MCSLIKSSQKWQVHVGGYIIQSWHGNQITSTVNFLNLVLKWQDKFLSKVQAYNRFQSYLLKIRNLWSSSLSSFKICWYKLTKWRQKKKPQTFSSSYCHGIKNISSCPCHYINFENIISHNRILVQRDPSHQHYKLMNPMAAVFDAAEINIRRASKSPPVTHFLYCFP
jgi:hypothetical protein